MRDGLTQIILHHFKGIKGHAAAVFQKRYHGGGGHIIPLVAHIAWKLGRIHFATKVAPKPTAFINNEFQVASPIICKRTEGMAKFAYLPLFTLEQALDPSYTVPAIFRIRWFSKQYGTNKCCRALVMATQASRSIWSWVQRPGSNQSRPMTNTHA